MLDVISDALCEKFDIIISASHALMDKLRSRSAEPQDSFNEESSSTHSLLTTDLYLVG
jgi:hypothetical protein